MKRAPRLVWMQHRLSLCRLVQDSKVYWVSESSSSVHLLVMAVRSKRMELVVDREESRRCRNTAHELRSHWPIAMW